MKKQIVSRIYTDWKELHEALLLSPQQEIPIDFYRSEEKQQRASIFGWTLA